MVLERWPRSRLDGVCVALGLAGCQTAEPTASGGPRAGQVDFACPVATAPSGLRRVTRIEYAAAIEDVFGITLDVEAALPRDEVVSGFDNDAASLGMTDLHVEAFLKLAEQIAARVAGDAANLRALGDCDGASPECALSLVIALGSRLFRRPLTETERTRLTAMFAGDFSEHGLREGSELVIAALLQAPTFLYRLDQAALAGSKGAAGERPLAAPEVLASRLSFLFWNSVPDEALTRAAASGRLASAQDVEREARRLWLDARTKRSLWRFHEQWLGLSDFNDTEKNPRLFSLWDAELRRDLGLETRAFVTGVGWEGDRSLTALLTAPYTYADARLRDFYGLAPGGEPQELFAQVAFPASAPRAGLLTQGSVLAALSHADQTSPVLRGKFIRERLFCTAPPPPPPELAVSTPVLNPRLTTRERFEQHTSDPGCAGCHRLLDPIGLAFEHYDASGHYRDTEADVPIDATGFLVGTDVDGPFDGAIELSRKLAGSDQVRRCVVSQWFRYAFGREATAEESCTLDRLSSAFRDSGGDLQELMVGLTQTEPFLNPHRAATEAP
jgi:hypothetical protein